MSTPEPIVEEVIEEESPPEEKKLPELGLHQDIPFEEYLKSPGISKHGLDQLNQSPAHYIASKNEPFAPSQAMIVGSAFHCLTLEPHTFDDEFVVNKQFADFRTKLAKEWKAEQIASGKDVLTLAEYENVQRMVDAVRNDPYASVLCDPESGKAEVSGYWIDNDKKLWEPDGMDPTFRLCRLRADFLNEAHHIAVDLKKAVCAGASKFGRDINNYRYHVQDAFYSDGLRYCGFKARKFVFVVVEPEPPYAVGVYSLSENDRSFARQLYKRNLQRYHECMTNNEWPAYPQGIRELELPKYSQYVDYY